MTANAKDLALSRLAQRQTTERNAPATNRRGNPLLLNERSENVQTISRPDRSTVDPNRGNRVFPEQLDAVTTYSLVGRNVSTSPSGTDETTGY